jgi:hypothetical protein
VSGYRACTTVTVATATVTVAAVVSLAACSSSSSSSATTATAPVVTLTSAPSVVPSVPSSSAASAGATGSASAQDEAAIKAAWIEFFNGKTPAQRKIGLVEDGQQLAQYINGQAGSALAQQVQATVSSVHVTSPDRATVVFSILIAGQPALSNETGTAVREGGQWKVGLISFCGLLQLQGQTPPQCASASAASPSAT